MVRIREQVSLIFAIAIAGEFIKEDIVVSGTMPKVLADVESRNWVQALLQEEDEEEDEFFLEEELPNLRNLGMSSKLTAPSCSRLAV